MITQSVLYNYADYKLTNIHTSCVADLEKGGGGVRGIMFTCIQLIDYNCLYLKFRSFVVITINYRIVIAMLNVFVLVSNVQL